jgi:hypothetical protein
MGMDAAVVGRGIGRDLLAAAEQEGRKEGRKEGRGRGLRRLELMVMTDNLRALGLYLRRFRLARLSRPHPPHIPGRVPEGWGQSCAKRLGEPNWRGSRQTICVIGSYRPAQDNCCVLGVGIPGPGDASGMQVS